MADGRRPFAKQDAASGSSLAASSGCRAATPSPCHPVTLEDLPIDALRAIVNQHGTPTYAYDLSCIRGQVARLRSDLPQALHLYYSFKANASLGLCGFLAECGLGADVASTGELLTALEAGYPPDKILVTGPDRSPALLGQLHTVPEAILSIDSLSELQVLARQGLRNRAVLRLRPDFHCKAVCTAGPDSRFGLIFDDLLRCRDYLGAGGVRVVGFHVFAGSQVLDPAAVVHHLSGAVAESLRAADVLGLSPEIIDVGGGFGIPYGRGECELDLAPIGDELAHLLERAAPAQILMELGRYLVAQSGWYLTTVLALQNHGGRKAVVVDGGTHQRGDLCGLGLRRRAFPPVLLDATPPRSPPWHGGDRGGVVPTDVLGCLSNPGDVLTEASLLPPLAPGDVLAFPNAGAYGLGASPWMFHGHPVPAEVAFDGTKCAVLRWRQSARSILEGQARVVISD